MTIGFFLSILFLISLLHRSALVLTEKIYQTLKTDFYHISRQLPFCLFFWCLALVVGI